jgi:hypothetical protein
MKAQFTLYVDENADLSFEIEGENLRDLLNQADKFEKIGLEWAEEETDRKPLTRRQKISRRVLPLILLIEGIGIGVVGVKLMEVLFGIHL